MKDDPRLSEARVELFSFAVSDRDGEAVFHITNVDYSDPTANRGTSSLLAGGGAAIRESIAVQTRRLDGLIDELTPNASRIGLWIDVEGAEFNVLQGISGISDRVAAVHVETSVRPLREGQVTTDELTGYMKSIGFGTMVMGFEEKHVWGDVVYVHDSVRSELGWRYEWFLRKSKLSASLGVGHVAIFLQRKFPRLYRACYRMYHRFGV